VPHPSFTPLNLAPQQQVALPDPSQSASNPIGALQEYCQQNYLPLPEYQIEPCAEGFTCQVQAVGRSASGSGPNKKTAKAAAALALLATLTSA
jgi:dsRNA-specific ribonuclease